MAESLKILGQVSPSATILTDVYIVPSNTYAVISTIAICNTNSTAIDFRIAIAQAGDSDNIKQYIYRDQQILKNDSIFATIGITLNAGDVIRVYSDTANVSFSVFGTEVNVFNVPAGSATATTQDISLYVDGTSGSDANDGSDWSNALKTIQKANDLLPDILLHNVSIILRGTFAGEAVYFDRIQPTRFPGTFKRIIVSGEDELTTLAGPYTSDINSISTIGLTTAGWTVDDYIGRVVEITSGPATGEKRIIKSNTATTVTVVDNFSVDPGASAQFKIGEWKTKFTGFSSISNYMTSGNGFVHFQRMTLDDYSFINVSGTGGITQVSNIVINGTGLPLAFAGAIWVNSANVEIRIDPSSYDPTTFAVDAASKGGVGQRNASGKLRIDRCYFTGLKSSVIRNVEFYNTRIGGSGLQNLRVLGKVETFNCYDPEHVFLNNDVDIKNSSGPGLLIDGGFIGHASGDKTVNIHDCSANGIEVKNNGSFISDANAGYLQGTGNTNFGLYAHEKALVRFPNGKAPSITGSTGDVTINNSTETSTWSALDGGTAIDGATSGNNEFVLVKEF